ncbi:MAG TPA: molybdenum cofactor guanylyltransferase [Acidimicrobiia bacterium]|nr:molybdenum cofactor guanylyltransferase [Acidimicrobiia bacterium]
MSDVIGAILTGGKSTRMGRDKADVIVGDQTMLAMVAKAMSKTVEQVVLLGADRDNWVCWPDVVHASGPLAGVATALTRAGSDRVLVVAVDQPFVRSETMRALLAVDSDVPVVPVDATGSRQVTCSVYPTSIADAAIDEAANGGSIQTLLDRVSFRAVTADEWSVWGEDGRSWFSVDTDEDLATGVREYL